MTIQTYAKYILSKGTIDDKRSLLANLKGRLTFKVFARVIVEKSE